MNRMDRLPEALSLVNADRMSVYRAEILLQMIIQAVEIVDSNNTQESIIKKVNERVDRTLADLESLGVSNIEEITQLLLSDPKRHGTSTSH